MHSTDEEPGDSRLHDPSEKDHDSAEVTTERSSLVLEKESESGDVTTIQEGIERISLDVQSDPKEGTSHEWLEQSEETIKTQRDVGTCTGSDGNVMYESGKRLKLDRTCNDRINKSVIKTSWLFRGGFKGIKQLPTTAKKKTLRVPTNGGVKNVILEQVLNSIGEEQVNKRNVSTNYCSSDYDSDYEDTGEGDESGDSELNKLKITSRDLKSPSVEQMNSLLSHLNPTNYKFKSEDMKILADFTKRHFGVPSLKEVMLYNYRMKTFSLNFDKLAQSASDQSLTEAEHLLTDTNEVLEMGGVALLVFLTLLCTAANKKVAQKKKQR